MDQLILIETIKLFSTITFFQHLFLLIEFEVMYNHFSPKMSNFNENYSYIRLQRKNFTVFMINYVIIWSILITL